VEALMPWTHPLPPDTQVPNLGDPANHANAILEALAAMGTRFNIQSPEWGTADPNFGTNSTNAISLASAAAAASGAAVLFPPGTYMVDGTLAKNTLAPWIALGGRGSVILKLASGANAPVLTSANFATLSMSGSNTAGISGLGIHNIIFDGNASNQSVPAAFGVGIYGYDYQLENCTVRNCLAVDGLYTEWGMAGGAGLVPDLAMESHFRRLRIHDNTLTGAGWHCRGPHDSRMSDVTIYSNTTSAYGFWCETTGGTYTAVGLSGTAVSSTPATNTFNTVLGLPSAGKVTMPSAGGTVTITYTGTASGNQLTGCSAAGGSGNYTSNTVTPPGYSGTAALIDGMHVWGSHSIGMVLDCEAHLVNCQAEGASTGQLLVRGGNCSWRSGRIFNPSGNSSYGVQFGDTVNQCSGMDFDAQLSGFTGSAAAQAYLNFVNTASGRYKALIFTTSANRALFNTGGTGLQPYEERKFFFGGTTITPSVAAAAGSGTSPPAPTLSNASDNRGTVNTGTGTATTAGSQATVTFAQQKPGTPTIAVWGMNTATAGFQPYASGVSATGFSVAFGLAPTISQATGTYVFGYADVT
jgi:Pectate lyase superfamily protein